MNEFAWLHQHHAGKLDRMGKRKTTDEEIARRRHNCEQVAAISAFDGRRPSPEFLVLRERYIVGEITVKEFQKLVLARWKRTPEQKPENP